MKRGLPYDLVFDDREAPLKMAFLTLLALVLRFVWYDAQPLWTDEVITWEFARADWPGLLFRQLYDASPPGFYLLLKQWLHLVPADEALRWLPMLLGAATVPLTYLLGAKLLNRKVGLLGALVLAINPLHIYYSNELRYPTLLTFMLALQVWLFVRVLENARWRDIAIWAAVSAMALWVQYLTGFFLVVEGAFAILVWRKDFEKLLRLAVGSVAIALLFLPWLPEMALQMAKGKPSREFFGIAQELFIGPAFLFLGGSEWSLPTLFGIVPQSPIYLLLAILLMLPFGAVLIFGMKSLRQKQNASIALLLVVGVFLMLVAAGQILPMFRPKYLLPLLPLLCIWAGAGLSAAEKKKRLLAWPLTMLLLLVSGYGVYLGRTDQNLAKEPWDVTAATIIEMAQPGDVAAVPNDYYSIALRRELGNRLPLEAAVCRTPHEQRIDQDRAIAVVKRLFGRYPRVWYVDHDAHLFDPQGFFPEALRNLGIEITWPSFPSNRHFSVRLYARDEATALASYAGEVNFGTQKYSPRQIVDGILPGPIGYAWMQRQGLVQVARNFREDIAFACFYIHLPFFQNRPTTFTLLVDGIPTAVKKVEASDLVCLEGAIPVTLDDKNKLTIGLLSDRTFVPNEVLGDGDRTVKSVLLQRMGITGSRCILESQ